MEKIYLGYTYTSYWDDDYTIENEELFKKKDDAINYVMKVISDNTNILDEIDYKDITKESLEKELNEEDAIRVTLCGLGGDLGDLAFMEIFVKEMVME